MVNGFVDDGLGGTTVLVRAYVAVVLVTLALLAVLSVTDPRQATSAAWGHAVVVAVLAGVLVVRLRAARRGSRSARRAVGVICLVLVVVNLVEAALPGAFPAWMRVEMVLLAGLTGLAARRAVRRA